MTLLLHEYHPFMPLENEYQLKRQIEINDREHEKIFGKLYKPTGFFPPEMGMNMDVARIIKEAGYDWTVTDAPV